MVCTFFGHKDTPTDIYGRLVDTVEALAANHTVDRFLIGHQGTFDSLVLKVLRELKQKYPHIQYRVVLAYMPSKEQYTQYDMTETILPEGIENVPKRYAISWRNKWLVKKSEIVVCYVAHAYGGAAQFVEQARKQGKVIVNLAASD